jgi:hypothetical protein
LKKLTFHVFLLCELSVIFQWYQWHRWNPVMVMWKFQKESTTKNYFLEIFQWYHRLCRNRCSGVTDTAEPILAVSLTPLKLKKNVYGWCPFEIFTSPSQWFQQCNWYQWNFFSGGIDYEMAMIIRSKMPAVSLIPLKKFQGVSMTFLKWFQWCHWHCRNSSVVSLTLLE